MNTSVLTHGSLFSGIGGFDLAARWAGFENKFHCEWNPFGQQVLQHHFPESESYEDITKTNFNKWGGQITILSGGFPCQPFSLAGKRKGADDDRYLWPQMLRAIKEIRPLWVIGENVAGIATMVQPGKVIGVESQTSLFETDDSETTIEEQEYVIETVCSDLEHLGYTVQPMLIPACAVGAPHRRDRVWFIARLQGVTTNTDSCSDLREPGGHEEESSEEWISERNSVRESDEPSRVRESFTDTGSNRHRRGSMRPKSNIAEEWTVDCNEERDRNGVRSETERCSTAFAHTDSIRFIRREYEDRPEASVLQQSQGRDTRPFTDRKSGNAWQEFPTQPPVYAGDDGIPRQLSGRPLSGSKWRQESVKACGNAIVPQVAYEIFKVIYDIETGRI